MKKKMNILLLVGFMCLSFSALADLASCIEDCKKKYPEGGWPLVDCRNDCILEN